MNNKDRTGKPPMHLLTPFGKALEHVAWAMQHGIDKGYAPHNWIEGADWSTYVGAKWRHATQADDPLQPGRDKDSKQLHRAHEIANALILLTYEIHGIPRDDMVPATIE